VKVLVTGVAGFIGMPAAKSLLARGATVVGVDNFDPYYDVALKEARLATLDGQRGFSFQRMDLADAAATAKLFRDHAFTHVGFAPLVSGIDQDPPGARRAEGNRVTLPDVDHVHLEARAGDAYHRPP